MAPSPDPCRLYRSFIRQVPLYLFPSIRWEYFSLSAINPWDLEYSRMNTELLCRHHSQALHWAQILGKSALCMDQMLCSRRGCEAFSFTGQLPYWLEKLSKPCCQASRLKVKHKCDLHISSPTLYIYQSEGGGAAMKVQELFTLKYIACPARSPLTKPNWIRFTKTAMLCMYAHA